MVAVILCTIEYYAYNQGHVIGGYGVHMPPVNSKSIDNLKYAYNLSYRYKIIQCNML